MSRFKSFLFLLLCFGLGIGLATAYTHFLHHVVETPTPSHHGTGNPPSLRGFSLPPNVATNFMDSLLPLHTTAVALTYNNNPDTLAQFTRHAHDLGLKVLLQPAPTFSKENPYPKPLTQIAAEAQVANIDILCLSWLNTDPDPTYWKSQITQLREIFHGRLLLATTAPIIPAIEFTNVPDIFGVIGPIDLPRRLPHANDTIARHDLEVAWNCYLESFESISRKTGKAVMLLNMSVPPAVPTKIGSDNPPIDPTLQSLVYESLLSETRGRPNIEALFLKWTPEASPQTPSADPFAANHLPTVVTAINTAWSPPSPAATAAAAAAEAAAATEDADSDTDQ